MRYQPAADISKRTLYRYFGSREGVIEAAGARTNPLPARGSCRCLLAEPE